MTAAPSKDKEREPVRDPVKAALMAARNYSVAFFNLKCGGGAPALPRRLKEFPQLLLQAGLAPTLAFYASKLDKEEKWQTFIEALKAVIGNTQAVTSRFCRYIRNEGEGYAHALAIIYAYTAPLAECNLQDIIGSAGSASNPDMASVRMKFVECLRKVSDEGSRIERMVLAYASEVKKLFTALYGEK